MVVISDEKVIYKVVCGVVINTTVVTKTSFRLINVYVLISIVEMTIELNQYLKDTTLERQFFFWCSLTKKYFENCLLLSSTCTDCSHILNFDFA